MIFKRIAWGSSDFEAACRLRDEILRAPIGLCLTPEDIAAEKDQLHFALFDDTGALVACVIAAQLSTTGAKIRQMAVSAAHQRQGYGQQIIRGLENSLAQYGYRQLSMHARTSAVGFYEKLGYTRSGPEFIEVGLPHFKMEKHLGR